MSVSNILNKNVNFPFVSLASFARKKSKIRPLEQKLGENQESTFFLETPYNLIKRQLELLLTAHLFLVWFTLFVKTLIEIFSKFKLCRSAFHLIGVKMWQQP